MFILEGSVLHNPYSLLAHALEFSSLGNQTHIYSVTK